MAVGVEKVEVAVDVPATHIEQARALGAWIARNGHTLVYGGAKGGLMDAVAEGALLICPDECYRITNTVEEMTEMIVSSQSEN